jgi:hypothetical protein
MFKCLLWAIMVFAMVSASCGKDECEKARDLQKAMCVGKERCLPCACYLRNEVPQIGTNTVGIPDATNSLCVKPGPCTGEALEDAKFCIDDQTTCDPEYYKDIRLFDGENPEPGFEAFCGDHWLRIYPVP